MCIIYVYYILFVYLVYMSHNEYTCTQYCNALLCNLYIHMHTNIQMTVYQPVFGSGDQGTHIQGH